MLHASSMDNIYILQRTYTNLNVCFIVRVDLVVFNNNTLLLWYAFVCDRILMMHHAHAPVQIIEQYVTSST